LEWGQPKLELQVTDELGILLGYTEVGARAPDADMQPRNQSMKFMECFFKKKTFRTRVSIIHFIQEQTHSQIPKM
jgi:hypothetical protein